MAEAGTGVGKTFAYLVPLLLSGRRALVSTATKSLQDQLFLRDLPRLRDALRLPMRLALLKAAPAICACSGFSSRARVTSPTAWRGVRWHGSNMGTATRTGDLAELDGLDDRSPVIPLVTSTRENCLGSDARSSTPAT